MNILLIIQEDDWWLHILLFLRQKLHAHKNIWTDSACCSLALHVFYDSLLQLWERQFNTVRSLLNVFRRGGVHIDAAMDQCHHPYKWVSAGWKKITAIAWAHSRQGWQECLWAFWTWCIQVWKANLAAAKQLKTNTKDLCDGIIKTTTTTKTNEKPFTTFWHCFEEFFFFFFKLYLVYVNLVYEPGQCVQYDSGIIHF